MTGPKIHLKPNKKKLKYNDQRRTLRSSNNRVLDEPRANLKTYGEKAFFRGGTKALK